MTQADKEVWLKFTHKFTNKQTKKTLDNEIASIKQFYIEIQKLRKDLSRKQEKLELELAEIRE